MNRRKDLPIGIAMLVLALLVLWHVQSFPPAPGQPYNAALFPGLAAVGLGLTAIVVIIQSLRAGDTPDPAITAETAPPGDDQPVAVDTRSPAARAIAIALTVGAIVFYIFTVETLGFLLCGTLILAALMWAYGVRPALVLPVAIAATLLIHVAFYKFLKVPLPWGLLQPFAW